MKLRLDNVWDHSIQHGYKFSAPCSGGSSSRTWPWWLYYMGERGFLPWLANHGVLSLTKPHLQKDSEWFQEWNEKREIFLKLMFYCNIISMVNISKIWSCKLLLFYWKCFAFHLFIWTYFNPLPTGVCSRRGLDTFPNQHRMKGNLYWSLKKIFTSGQRLNQ